MHVLLRKHIMILYGNYLKNLSQRFVSFSLKNILLRYLMKSKNYWPQMIFLQKIMKNNCHFYITVSVGKYSDLQIPCSVFSSSDHCISQNARAYSTIRKKYFQLCPCPSQVHQNKHRQTKKQPQKNPKPPKGRQTLRSHLHYVLRFVSVKLKLETYITEMENWILLPMFCWSQPPGKQPGFRACCPHGKALQKAFSKAVIMQVYIGCWVEP